MQKTTQHLLHAENLADKAEYILMETTGNEAMATACAQLAQAYAQIAIAYKKITG